MKDITIFLSIMLIGCTSKLSFNPSEMPPAKLHQEYYQEITISGGLVEPVSIDIKCQWSLKSAPLWAPKSAPL